MLKFWIGGAVVTTALSAAVIGGWTYASHRAIAVVDARFAALHAGGIEATHGAIAVDLWHHSMRIDDIRLVGRGFAGDLKGLALTGVDPWSDDLIAERADVTGLHLTASLAGPADTPVRLVIDEPTATATRLHVRATPLDLGGAKGAAQRLAAMFAAVDAEAASMPSTTTRLEIDAPASKVLAAKAPAARSTAFDATYTDLSFDHIHDGTIGAVGYRTATFDSTSGDHKDGHGTVEGFRVTGVDTLPYFEIGLARRHAVDGFYPVQDGASAGASSFEAAGHAATQIAKSHVGAVSIDPTKMSLLRIDNLLSDIGSLGPETTPDAAQALLRRVAEIYEGVRIASIAIDGLHSTSHENGIENAFKCDRITLTQWTRGRIDDLTLDGLSGDFKASPSAAVATPWRLGSIKLAGLDLPQLLQTAATLQPHGQPLAPGKAKALLHTLAGFDVSGAAIPTPPLGQLLEIETLSTHWGQFVGDVPTDATIAFKGTLPLSPTDPTVAPLRHLGIPKLAVDSTLHSAWNAADFRFDNTASLAVARLGNLDASVRFGNVQRDAFAPDVVTAMGAMAAVDFGALDLTVHDAGAVKLLRATLMAIPPAPAEPPPPQGLSVTPPEPTDPIALLKQLFVDPPHANGNLDRIFDAFGQFLAAPGQTLVLSVKPAAPIRISDVLALRTDPGPAALAVFFEKFHVIAEVKPQ